MHNNLLKCIKMNEIILLKIHNLTKSALQISK